MTDIEVRTKDPCRFCSERNLPECSGSCQSKSVKRRLDLQLKAVVEENAELKQQLEVAEKMIEIAIRGNCTICTQVNSNITCYGCIKQQALERNKESR